MSGTPVIAGPGYFDIEVVGESHYLKSFAKICGPRCTEGVDMEVRAHLTLDDLNPYDKMAVRVSVNGHVVGHLPRDVARDFRRAVKAGGLSEYLTFECAGHIRGGWDKGGGDVGHYGVKLDLPQDDD
jgi:hypothetical protein